MSSFAGISMVTGGRADIMPAGGQAHITPAVDSGTDSGYHLLVVKDYSRAVQDLPTGSSIWSGRFMVGGHWWRICCDPNGNDLSCADFISLQLGLLDDDDEMEDAVEVKFQFSFIDQVEYQKPMYIRARETRSFSVEHRCWGCMKFMKRDALERSAHLKADCFTIRCDVMVCNDLNTQDAGDTVSDIGHHFKILLQDKLGSDVTFEVSGQTFSAHRCVLAARSKVFRAQLFGPMAEGVTSSAIQIKDMEAKVFAALLSFVYSDSFPEMEEDETQAIEGEEKGEVPEVEEGQEEEATEHVTWLQDLFVAADRYDIQQLKFLCEKQLSEHIGVTSVASTLALAEQHHCQRLKEACFKFIEGQSPECLDKVMATDGWGHMVSTHPSVLNELVAKLVSNQKKDKKRKH
ncbi:BTB/POZ and MATH domain-containing protein 1-like [Lolium rigidum]|uniref:BTB/POZ and MATH domain-containing protein 1-like n=1 Tax=Lolium rigidum TaxID=89674 RepID=UPI001F5C9F9A|nr:BTB/POZ and MATH domain-containing protein 1-like [Lolium rigidum]XP_047082810.1 BTB/POZ and MATH domain-containing protein 1-like [Lolium rigidum]